MREAIVIHLLDICVRLGQGIERALQLNNVADRFRYERRFESFFDCIVIGIKKFSELISDPDNK